MMNMRDLASCAAITDRGIASLGSAACRHLRDLNLACLPRVTADGVACIAESLGVAQLVSLELGGCTAISSAELITRFGPWLELDDDEDGLAKVQG